MTSPTLQDLFENDRVKAISFWCTNQQCLCHDIEHKGMVAIDHGPGKTLEDLKAECRCRRCETDRPMDIKPNWGEGGINLLEKAERSVTDMPIDQGKLANG